MTQSWMGDNGGPSLLARAIAVTVVVVGFFAIATGAVPVRCWIGGTCGGAKADAKIDAKTEKASNIASTAEASKPVPVAPVTPKVEPVVAEAAPTLTSNNVIAGSFAQLKVELNPPTKLPPVQVAAASPAGTPAATVTDPDTGLSKRVVRAVSIHADGTPDLSGNVAEAYASGPHVTPQPPSPAVDAAASIGAGQRPSAATQTIADLTPAKGPSSPAPKATSTPGATSTPNATSTPKAGEAEVTGQGANVRAAPATNSKVLFALRGGTMVTIVGSQRRWMQIRDNQGRTGWMYGDALRRG